MPIWQESEALLHIFSHLSKRLELERALLVCTRMTKEMTKDTLIGFGLVGVVFAVLALGPMLMA